MSYIKYKMSYTSNVYWICPLMPIYIYIYMSRSTIYFPSHEGKGNKSLDVFYCRVEGDGEDDRVLLIRSLILLLRLFSNSSWYKQSRYESVFIICWNQIYVHTKSIIFLPPSNSHSVSPPRRLMDDQASRDPTTIQ